MKSLQFNHSQQGCGAAFHVSELEGQHHQYLDEVIHKKVGLPKQSRNKGAIDQLEGKMKITRIAALFLGAKARASKFSVCSL